MSNLPLCVPSAASESPQMTCAFSSRWHSARFSRTSLTASARLSTKSALFVDKRADAVKLVRENLALCHLEENAQVICGDSLAALGTQSGRFDIIFLDPPYESGLLEQAMEKIAQFDILSPHGIMVAESPQNQTLPELPAPYGLYREYRYGKIKVSIYHRAVEEEA